jgi:hypothetical protein
MDDININGETKIFIGKNKYFKEKDSYNSINLKLMTSNKFPPKIHGYKVPIQIRDINTLDTSDWDFTHIKVIQYIDGCNDVKEISNKSNVEMDLVKKSLSILYYHKLIKFVYNFDMTNIYSIHSHDNYMNFIKNKEMQYECLRYISNTEEVTEDTDEDSGILFSDVFNIFCKMNNGNRLKDIVDLNNTRINYRKLIIFGLLNQIIVRILEYPVLDQDILLEKDSNYGLFG